MRERARKMLRWADITENLFCKGEMTKMECIIQKPKILILDSDQAFLAQCQSELQKHGMLPMADKPEAAATAASQIAQYKPDVIITDLYIGKMDSAQFIQHTRQQAVDNHPQFIVLSSYNDRNLFQECCEMGAAYCMIKPIDFVVLSARINKVCAQPKKKSLVQGETLTPIFNHIDLKAQVTRILHRIGIPAHIKGYSFLRFAVITVIKDPNALDVVTKRLYPIIAKEFGTTVTRVERAMRHAIDMAWSRGNNEAQQELFGYKMQGGHGKPTTSEFIALIADTLRIQNPSIEQSMAIQPHPSAFSPVSEWIL